MGFHLGQKIKGQIAAKIAVPIVAVMVVIFVLVIVLASMLTGNSMSTAGEREMKGIAEKNAAIIQGVFDSINSTCEGIADYLYSEYDGSANFGSATTQELDGVQFYSTLFGVPCTKSTYECELVLRRIFEANVGSNPAILNMGAVFEPYSFDSNIEAFGMLVEETADGAETSAYDSYSSYSGELFYTMTKEAMASVTTPVYDHDGTDIITATYPIIYKNELMGLLYADINLSYLSEQLQDTSINFDTQVSCVVSPDGAVQYSSIYNALDEQVNIVDKYFSDQRTALETSLNGEQMFSATDANGELFIFVPIEVSGDTWWAETKVDVAELNAQSSQLILFLIVILVLALVLLVGMIVTLIHRNLKPIGELRHNLNLLGQGKLSQMDVRYTSADELGHLAEDLRGASSMMATVIHDQSMVLTAFADGDFSARCQSPECYVGELRVMYDATGKVSQNLSDAFREIDLAANQVAAGADQVSSGSQAMSQGATEQASAVEELAATVQDISHQIDENAERTKTANAETADAGDRLKISSQKMQELMAAMDEIKQTSTEIQGIIKTIDDIAFQTNILALNAAVEAARAGVAGKGFAVVADEVRSLAGKSAEASKTTQELIEKSIRAVDSGNALAIETSEVLVATVEDASRVVTAMHGIAQASSEQAKAVDQVTIGLDQISSVVQTNSATAEQSAAASEELSGQAGMLKTLIDRFKFAGGETAAYSPMGVEEIPMVTDSSPSHGEKY